MHRSAVSLVRLLPASECVPADAHLLRAFATARNDGAFAELVRRHGPVVLAACRRVLGNTADAEDAFQAVFLVLARKADTVRGNLAGWLYAVSVRTARGVRVMRARRRKHETRASHRCEPAVLPAESDHDLAAVIDEELARLPEYYREAIVLCELRGLSRKQAAAELGVPEGTLASRLAAAKRKLAALLSARGLAPAALVALLAPASVSAGLVESAVFAVRGAAGPVVNAAASAVVKAMLFDQLKTVTLAVGILLTVVCGGWATTGKSGGSDPAPPAPPAPRIADPAAKLVEQLGAPEFAVREETAKQLRALGTRAEPALKAALRSDDPEVRDRAVEVLAAIRGDAREAFVKTFDPAGTADYDHPVWTRFKSIAGADAAARKLFAEIISDPRYFRLLDNADRDPERAGDLYAAEVDRVYAAIQKVLDLPTTGTPGPKIVPWPALPAVLYLGTYPSSTGKVKEGWAREGHVFLAESFGRWDKSPSAPALKRVFAAWLVRRDHPQTLERGLDIAVASGIDSLLPLARKEAANAKKPVHLRLAALAAVAQFGTPADLPFFEALFADETPVATSIENRTGFGSFGRKITTQARDAAAGMALLLFGEDPYAHGFWRTSGRWQKIGNRPSITRYELTYFGFHDVLEKQRADAHAKAKAFLDNQPKTEPKPDGQLHRLDGHTGLVGGVAFFPTGDKIVTSGYDATYRIWDAKTGKELDQRSTGTTESQVGGPVAVAPDGKRIAARYFVAASDTGKFLFGLEGHTGRIARIAYSLDGQRLLTASHDGTVRVWDAEGKELQRIEAHMGQKVALTTGGLQPREDRYVNRGAWDAAFSPDGKRIVSGGVDGTVRVWDVDTAKELQCMKLDRVTVMAVAVLPDDKRVLSAGSDGVIRIWDAATGKELGKFEGHTGIVAALAVTRDGKRVVSAGHDKTVRVWDVETREELRCFRGHRAAVQAVAVSPDGKTALSGGEDNTARLWALPAVER